MSIKKISVVLKKIIHIQGDGMHTLDLKYSLDMFNADS